MILYAMCDYLAKQNVSLKQGKSITRLTINGKSHTITNPSWKPKKVIIPAKDIQGDRLRIAFTKGDPTHQYRIVYRYWNEGKGVEATVKGITIARSFELINQAGKRLKLLKSGDTIPRGSYVRSVVSSRINKQRASFVLLVNPKLSASEYTAITGAQKSRNQPFVLEEKKDSRTYWHYEQAYNGMRNTSTYRVEMAGTFLIAPAYAELMYDTAVRGNSDSFQLIVKDE